MPATRLASLATLMLGTAAAAQGMPSFTPDATDLPANGTSVPLVRLHELPVVEAMINGHGPYRLIVDSGAPCLLVSEALNEALDLPGPPGIPKGTKVVARSAHGSKGVPAVVAQVESLQIGDATFTGLFTIASPLPAGLAADGVAGMGIFRECLMTIDYPAGRFELAHGGLDAGQPDVLTYTTPSQPGSHPVIELFFNGAPHPFVMDTGMNRWLTVPEASVQGATYLYGPVEGPRLRTVDTTTRFRVARLEGALGVGPHSIIDPIVTLDTDDRQSVIGSRALEHFVVTFDQLDDGGRVRLHRPAGTPVQVPARRVLGFELEPRDGHWFIGQVLDGAPAHDTGVQSGDRVMAVAGRPVGDLYGSAEWAALTNADTVKLTVVTGVGEPRTIEVPVFVLIPG